MLLRCARVRPRLVRIVLTRLRGAIVGAKSRYCICTTLYTGKEDVQHAELGALAATVLRELEAAGPLGDGHHVVCDRAFTNIPLAFRLLVEHSTTLTGTVNANRRGVDTDAVDLADEELSGKILRGTYGYATTVLSLPGDQAPALASATNCVATLTRWQGSRPATFLSTGARGGGGLGREAAQRNTKPPGKGAVNSGPYWGPLVRRLYNMLMGGVDGGGQPRPYYNMRLKRVNRWWAPPPPPASTPSA